MTKITFFALKVALAVIVLLFGFAIIKPATIQAAGTIVNLCGKPGIPPPGSNITGNGCGGCVATGDDGYCNLTGNTTFESYICRRGYYTDWQDRYQCRCDDGNGNGACERINLTSGTERISDVVANNNPSDICMVQMDYRVGGSEPVDFVIWKNAANCQIQNACQISTSTTPTSGSVDTGSTITFSYSSNDGLTNVGINAGGGVTNCQSNFQTNNPPYTWSWTCTAKSEGTWTASFTSDGSCSASIPYTVKSASCSINMPGTVVAGSTFNYSVNLTGSTISSKSVTSSCSNLTGCPNGTSGSCSGTLKGASAGTCRLTVNLSNGKSCQQTTQVSCQQLSLTTGVAASDSNGNCPSGTYSTTNINLPLPPKVCIKGVTNPSVNGNNIQVNLDGTTIGTTTNNTPIAVATNSFNQGNQTVQTVFTGSSNYCSKNGTSVNLCVSSLPTPPTNPNLKSVNDNLNIPPVAPPIFMKSSDTTGNILPSDAPKVITLSMNLPPRTNRVLLVALSYLGSGTNVVNTQPSANVTILNAGITIPSVSGSRAVFLENNQAKRFSELYFVRLPDSLTGQQTIQARFGGLNAPEPKNTILGAALFRRVNTTTPLKNNPTTGNPGYSFTGFSQTSGGDGNASRNISYTLTTDITDYPFVSQTAQTPNDPVGNLCSATLLPNTGTIAWNDSATKNNVCWINGQGAYTSGKSPTTTMTWRYTSAVFPGTNNLKWAASGAVLRGESGTPGLLDWDEDFGKNCATQNNVSRIYFWKVGTTAPTSFATCSSTNCRQVANTSSYTFAANQMPAVGSYNWRVISTNSNDADNFTSSAKYTAGPIWQFSVIEPDFEVKAPQFQSNVSTCTSGTTNAIALTATTKNLGNYSGTTTIRIKSGDIDPLNPQRCFTPADLATQGVTNLAPGQTSTPTLVKTLDCPTTPGVYSYCAQADVQTTNPVERVTNNNAFSLTVTSRAPVYFQTIGAGITSLGNINSKLPVGLAISKKTVTGTIPGDAGIISAKTSITPGSGNFSENGAIPPGWNRIVGTLSSPRINELSYANLFTTVMTNAGVNQTLATTNCGALGYYDTGSYRVFCYANSNELNSAITSTLPAPITTAVAIPTNTLSPTVNALSAVQTNKRMIVFVNTSLSLSGDINISSSNPNAGITFVVNGNITVADNVRQVDGLYIFNGTFNTNTSTDLANPLTGNGSLVGTGTNAFNFQRSIATIGPSESWTYQPKYLWLFRNILTQPSYSWKELPPQ